MTGDLQRTLCKKLSEFLIAKPNLKDMVLQFAYNDLLIEVNDILESFDLMNHLVSKNLRIDDIMEVMRHRVDEINKIGDS